MSTRKRITELSVAELRSQLGKRGVEATGDRPALIAKLKRALQDEGAKPHGSVTRKTAAAAAAAATVVAAASSDAPGVPTTAEPQPAMMKEEQSLCRTDSDGPGPGPQDVNQSGLSSLDVSMNMESDSTSAATSLVQNSSVMQPPDTSTFDNSAQPTITEKDSASLSSFDVVTASKITSDKDGQTAAMTAELTAPATDELDDTSLPHAAGISSATSTERTRNESTDASLDKSNITEDKSGYDTTSAPVVNKTIGIEGTNAGDDNSLWVSGLTSAFRAADLKQLFGKFGKVITAKVVTSAKSPGSKCFGFIVMATADEAQEAISNLNNTEVQGQTITVEKDRQKRAILQPQATTKPLLATTTLWINGLSTETKAADLKMLFVKYGKVTGAKVVTSAKNPGTKCFGLVTMSSVEEAEQCIAHLNKTEFHGRIISLEKAKSDVKTQTKPNIVASGKAATETDGSAARKVEEKKTAVNKAAGEKEQQDSTDKKAANKPQEDRTKDVKKDKNILSLDKIKEERERERRMQRERAAREEERRRLRELERERRLQQEEADRVARERERLRLEKMRLERERMRAERTRMELERERQRQEKELEQERERLERQQREARQQAATYRSDMKRPAASGDDAYWQASKRPALETRDPSSSYGYNMYSSGSYEKNYDKFGQYGTGERRDTQLRSRESDKVGSSSASMWPNRPTEHRNIGSALTSYGSTSDWKQMRAHTSGVKVGEWHSTTSGFRGTGGNYSQVGADSNRMYSSSTSSAANNPYFTASSNQSYNKWY